MPRGQGRFRFLPLGPLATPVTPLKRSLREGYGTVRRACTVTSSRPRLRGRCRGASRDGRGAVRNCQAFYYSPSVCSLPLTDSSPASGGAFWYLYAVTEWVYPAQRRTASKALSTSSSVLAKPSEKRTVPRGKVESVLCALGAQCRPQRVSMPNSVSRRKATSALS